MTRAWWIGWGALALVAGGGLAVAGLGTALSVEQREDLALPVPTGPDAVGRLSATWVDAGAIDPLSPPPGTPRTVVVWIWYPAVATAVSPPADYMPEPWRVAIGRQEPSLMAAVTRDLAHVHAHSLADAPVALDRPVYPVVILRAGATAQALSYSTLAEDLASHGYVVVGLDAPYRTSVVVLPDGRVVARRPENNPELFGGAALARLGATLTADWSADVGFVLDRLARLDRPDAARLLAGHVDLARVGIMGHSFGGATAADFCRQDTRCRAGIDIDGALVGPVIQEGLSRPFLFLMSQLGDFSSDAEVRHIRADLDRVYARLPVSDRAYLSIRGANHFMFSDDGAVLKSGGLRRLMRLTRVLRIDGPRQLAVTAYAVRTFFDAYLKDAAPELPRFESPDYPELERVH